MAVQGGLFFRAGGGLARICRFKASLPSNMAAAPALKFHTSTVDSYRKEERYSWFNYVLGDWFSRKENERSKIFVIDGNLAVGKTTLGKELGEKLGMKYFPEVDVHYFDRFEGDGSPMDKRFSGNVSLEDYYKNPSDPDGHSIRFQMVMFMMRYFQFCEAMNHLIATGQGVILDRSVHSDFVFLEAMYKERYIKKHCYDYYYMVKEEVINKILPPHLVIYLDVPPEEVQKKIEKRGIEMEKDIPLSYLETLDDAYKNNFLKNYSKWSEVLTYDWTNYGDTELILEDINALAYENSPWQKEEDKSLHHRRRVLHDPYRVGTWFNIPEYIPEVTLSAIDLINLREEHKKLPGRRFAPGFNPDMGDRVWFKW
uniref:NADH dehydrogenase [ubiquinone] 1 alpha subcomplex subunit 10, mitochondrial n=1 Tax=Branchiostoma belcheri tsingtauense TaxID=155462 RepID=Q6WRX5_BRABE|nr:NADH-ubiquinone oxidoreductase 42 kDa subunit [Branchiostoma belcheri tsingtauense]